MAYQQHCSEYLISVEIIGKKSPVDFLVSGKSMREAILTLVPGMESPAFNIVSACRNDGGKSGISFSEHEAHILRLECECHSIMQEYAALVTNPSKSLGRLEHYLAARKEILADLGISDDA